VEPLLLQLPHHPAGASLLQAQLGALEAALQNGSRTSVVRDPEATLNDWLQEAVRLQASPPLLLAVGQQVAQLRQLLHSRGLVQQAIRRQSLP
jgi:hypothetical protein